ncbi:MAG TPA: hypothetical protein VGM05_09480 [Planctomycetaceae bacterium]|jgi:hypothetical protein
MTTTLTAAAAGLILGCPVALIWLSVSRRLGQIDFWPSCRRLTQSLLSAADEREFRAQYGQLLKLLAQYLARNLLLTAAASLPVILFVLIVAPAAGADGFWSAGDVSLLPCSAGPGSSFWSSSWSWLTGREGIFCTGLCSASSAGIFLFPALLPQRSP